LPILHPADSLSGPAARFPPNKYSLKPAGTRSIKASNRPCPTRSTAAFSRHGVIPHTLLETGNVDCIKDTVANGEAVSFLLHSFLDEDLENGRLRVIPIRDERIYLDVNIVYLKNQPLTPAANEFLNILMEVKRDQKAKEA